MNTMSLTCVARGSVGRSVDSNQLIPRRYESQQHHLNHNITIMILKNTDAYTEKINK